MSERYTLVTGVSTGIGRAVASRLAGGGFHVLGSVRREKDGEELSGALGDRFTPLVFDVTDDGAIDAAAEKTREMVGDRGLHGLVNNAGVGGDGPALHMPMERAERLFDVNVLGVLRVTRAFAPFLGADEIFRKNRGRIVNISSTSGRVVFPLFSIYAASKHALEGLSDGLRRELSIYGIDVIVIQPGVVATPIWRKEAGVLVEDLEEHRRLYGGTDFAQHVENYQMWLKSVEQVALPVEAVSDVVWKALTVDRPRARYALPEGGWRRRFLRWILFRCMPDRWVDGRIALR